MNQNRELLRLPFFRTIVSVTLVKLGSLVLQRTMSDLFNPPPAKLKAITINGAIHVESEDDVRRREERRKQRKSRWDKSGNNDYNPTPQQTKSDMSKALACFPNLDQNSRLVRERFEAQEKQKREKTLMQPSIDLSQVDDKSQKIYLLHLEIQDKTRLLARPDLGNSPLILCVSCFLVGLGSPMTSAYINR